MDVNYKVGDKVLISRSFFFPDNTVAEVIDVSEESEIICCRGVDNYGNVDWWYIEAHRIKPIPRKNKGGAPFIIRQQMKS